MSYDRTIVEVFEESCGKYANKEAFTCMGRTLTFADVERLSGNFASYLQNHTDLKPGDRIAIQLPNVLQYPVAIFGAIRAGLIVVNTNPLYTAREVKHQLNDSGARAMVVLANIANTAAEVIAETQVEQVIVTELGDLHGAVKGQLMNVAVKHVKKLVPAFSFPNQRSFNSVLKLGSKQPMAAVKRAAADVAILQYTGGTTGVAKGAMLTHRNLVANMVQAKEHLGHFYAEGEGVVVAPLPLYHIYAFTLHCMFAFGEGSHSLLIANPRDVQNFVKAMQGRQITAFVGINTLFNALCAEPAFRALDFSKLTSTSSGGMALTKEAARIWQDATGCDVSEGFGMTETSPMVTANKPDAIQAGTVGTPVLDTELKVIDEEGAVLAVGEPGELCVRGPQVMKGYWERPEATAEVLDADGWLKTGDMAVIQADGYLKIVDRKKDMVIVSGFNVYPNEVEDVVCSHPGIVEAAVIGVEDAKSGEAVKLFVVRSDASLDAKAIRDFCKQNLTGYKVPRYVEFRDELPKSNVGKILRRELKDEEKQAAA
mgnify:CR=1 FL=1